MSTTVASSLTLVGQQSTIYLGIFIFLAGIIGNLLIILIFLSLQTFRQSSCTFYLTIMSIVNIGQLLTGLLSRIMIGGLDIDWTLTSLFYCKIRAYFIQVSSLISMTCMCLATIDQYFATCSRPQWQQWCNINLARRLLAIFILIWILHNIPFIIYYDQVISVTTGKITCVVTNNIYQKYTIYGVSVILTKFLPIFISCFFGILAYRNVQQLSHRTLPVVRRELDKQLTQMILLLVVVSVFSLTPYAIVYMLTVASPLMQNSVLATQLQFASTFTLILAYFYYTVGFYRLGFFLK